MQVHGFLPWIQGLWKRVKQGPLLYNIQFAVFYVGSLRGLQEISTLRPSPGIDGRPLLLGSCLVTYTAECIDEPDIYTAADWPELYRYTVPRRVGLNGSLCDGVTRFADRCIAPFFHKAEERKAAVLRARIHGMSTQ